MAKVSHDDMTQIEKLSGPENFQVWSFQVTVLLRAHELLSVVQEKPEEILMHGKRKMHMPKRY